MVPKHAHLGIVRKVTNAGRVNVAPNAGTVNSQMGPPGPVGPPGDGVEDLGYTHQQPSAADTWIVNHNLNKKCSCAVYTVGGVQVWAQVTIISDNQLQVLFDGPHSGYAVVN